LGSLVDEPREDGLEGRHVSRQLDELAPVQLTVLVGIEAAEKKVGGVVADFETLGAESVVDLEVGEGSVAVSIGVDEGLSHLDDEGVHRRELSDVNDTIAI